MQEQAALLTAGTLSTRFTSHSWGQNHPPVGTYPEGSSGGTVYIGATVPRTGTYAVQVEDELNGWQLAVEHINNGDPLLLKIAPKVNNGLIGKKVDLLVAAPSR